MPVINRAGVRATAEEANEALSSIGNPVTDAGDYTFFWMFDEPLPADQDYLCTVEVGGKTFGVVSDAASRVPGCTKLYFQLNNGKQTDFVDGVKCESPEDGKFDFSSFAGVAISSLYATDKQEDGTFPAGLRLVRQKSVRFNN